MGQAELGWKVNGRYIRAWTYEPRIEIGMNRIVDRGYTRLLRRVLGTGGIVAVWGVSREIRRTGRPGRPFVRTSGRHNLRLECHSRSTPGSWRRARARKRRCLPPHVADGTLPPVDERLPENPLVVVTMDEIGRYGGTIRRALTGDIVQTAGVNKTLSEGLVGYHRPLPTSIEHNLAESYHYEDEGRTAIFKIWKGIKWSDGHPFTVADILFWYCDTQVDDDARDNPVDADGLARGRRADPDVKGGRSHATCVFAQTSGTCAASILF